MKKDFYLHKERGNTLERTERKHKEEPRYVLFDARLYEIEEQEGKIHVLL